MTIVELLDQLRRRDIRVWAEGETLRYNAPPGSLTEDLREAVRSHRRAILEYLRDIDGVQHTSHYVQMRDGVRLAVDVFRPKRSGSVVTLSLPAIWCHDRYQRSVVQAGLVRTKLDTRPWLRHLVNHDYVVAVVDARGSGASTGVRSAEFSQEEVLDGYDITEWLAARPWCSGRVGMFGDSYLGIAQLLTASTAPPHLFAIFPEMVLFDLYDFLYPGGVFRHDFVHGWAERVRQLDIEPGVAAVDGHSDAIPGVLAEHVSNVNVLQQAISLPLRDSVDTDGHNPYVRYSPSSAVSGVVASGVAVYLLSGWRDIWVRDALLWFGNLTQHRKIVIGTGHHTDRSGINLTMEHLRWYDYWLKGIENDVMTEPAIRYVTMGAGQPVWRDSDSWPPADSTPQVWYLGPRTADAAHVSANSGALEPLHPSVDVGFDAYTLDYSCTTGRSSRWANGYGAPFGYGDFASEARRSLTYDSRPLSAALEVTGHSVVHLFITCTHDDADLFVYLEDADPAGVAHYVTEGVLRASHRALGEASYRDFGLPYHPSLAETHEPLDGDVAELVLDLYPISYVFAEGHRVRIRIVCCDLDNAATPVVTPAPILRIHRGSRWPSRVVLPVAPGSDIEEG